MSVQSPQPPQVSKARFARLPEDRRETTYRRIYPMRVLGMGLGALAIAGALYQQHAPWPSWAWVVVGCLAWPHLAFLHAALRRDPYRSERHNLLVDSVIAGISIPVMHFCLLPSAILATVTIFDRLSTGMRRLWLHSLPCLFGGMLAATLLLRPRPLLDGSVLVVACCLPLLVVHTLSSGLASYHLLRTIGRQNQLLEQLRRTDAQTGLLSREHLLEHAEAALRRFLREAQPACLLMIDIDHFKSINDTHGHGVGDEAIAAVAQAIRGCIRGADVAGRYGGDEFLVLCVGAPAHEVEGIAQRIREGVLGIRLGPGHPRLSCSIGVATLAPGCDSLRAWLGAVDQALYRAKAEGRNRVALHAKSDVNGGS